jgi:serine/threonine protein phosphatase PrpC
MITRAVGIDSIVDPDVLEVDVEPGDRLLACTDGLTTMLHDADIAAILSEDSDPQHAAEHLVSAANDAGGVDNVTVVVLDVGTVEGSGDAPSETVTVDAVTPEAADSDDDPTGELPLADMDPETETDRPRRWWQRRR